MSVLPTIARLYVQGTLYRGDKHPLYTSPGLRLVGWCGVVSDGVVSDGVVSDGAVSDGVVSDGALQSHYKATTKPLQSHYEATTKPLQR